MKRKVFLMMICFAVLMTACGTKAHASEKTYFVYEGTNTQARPIYTIKFSSDTWYVYEGTKTLGNQTYTIKYLYDTWYVYEGTKTLGNQAYTIKL